jgi:hypothetical protein
MERSRHGEGHDYRSQSLRLVGKLDQRLTPEPSVPQASAEELPDLEALDTPTIPGYLTLELDVSDLQVLTTETGAGSTQLDQEMHGCQEDPALSSLDFLEFCEPEESTVPGYLTLEIDLNELGDDAPWKSSDNAGSDGPRGKI